MAVLVGGIDGFRVEGDLFNIDRAMLAVIDALEDYDQAREPPGVYVRTQVKVASPADGRARDAIAYRARDATPWQALAADGQAELLACYERRLADATPKQCCMGSPGHAGPHDVIDPLAALRQRR